MYIHSVDFSRKLRVVYTKRGYVGRYKERLAQLDLVLQAIHIFHSGVQAWKKEGRGREGKMSGNMYQVSFCLPECWQG